MGLKLKKVGQAVVSASKSVTVAPVKAQVMVSDKLLGSKAVDTWSAKTGIDARKLASGDFAQVKSMGMQAAASYAGGAVPLDRNAIEGVLSDKSGFDLSGITSLFDFKKQSQPSNGSSQSVTQENVGSFVEKNKTPLLLGVGALIVLILIIRK